MAKNAKTQLKVDFSDLKRVLDKLVEDYKNRGPKWELLITHINNGYILKGNNDGDLLEHTIQDDEQDDLKSHEELLWLIMEYFNFGGSKHHPERLRVIREKQNEL